MPTYAELKQAAAALGLVDEICRGCSRTGVSRRRSANSPTGVITEWHCRQCDGSGRVWVLPRGAIGIQDSDAELWNRLQSECRGSAQSPRVAGDVISRSASSECLVVMQGGAPSIVFYKMWKALLWRVLMANGEAYLQPFPDRAAARSYADRIGGRVVPFGFPSGTERCFATRAIAEARAEVLNEQEATDKWHFYVEGDCED